MEPEERIARLVESGVLSEAQAATLRRSLVPSQPPEEPSRGRRRAWPGWLAGALVVGVVLVILVALLGGPDGREVQDVAKTLNDPGSTGAMNKTVSGLLALAILFIVPLVSWIWMHNALVTKEERALEAVVEAWAQVESNFQRRADLIPALLDIVSRYLRHESETLQGVTDARAAPAGGSAQAMNALIEAQEQAVALMKEHGKAIIEDADALTALRDIEASIGARVSTLLAVAERYPDLRSSDQFLELQAQLEGTENRINVARMRFNEAVRDFNAATRRIPSNLVARAGDFKRKAYFKADAAAGEAPSTEIR